MGTEMYPRDSEDAHGDNEEYLSVGAFLDLVNESFLGVFVSVRGEVFGLEERRGIQYFSLKDSEGSGVMSCILFRSDSLRASVSISEGMEVVVEGSPHIWKPRGKFSFRVSNLRPAGEGALKKAYDALKRRLTEEGVFDESRKRPMPTFPRRIALLTSREGAAIGDFTANLGRFGFSISLFDVHVEGSRSVAELLEGIRFFNTHRDRWDALVLIRGGGSLESLEAYNDERVVRAVAGSELPVIAGIGHEKDVPLATLAADCMVSTPTAVAMLLGNSWERANHRRDQSERTLLDEFQKLLNASVERVRLASSQLRDSREACLAPFGRAQQAFESVAEFFSGWMLRANLLEERFLRVSSKIPMFISGTRDRIAFLESIVRSRDPKVLLARGYAVLRKGNHVVGSAGLLSEGEEFNAILSDGELIARVVSIRKSGKR